uniref:Type-4 uracil-DNA glycosylase n=1 Tax=Candidatus Kentrum sp. UNK TaxID=2126344 RepID=A0A451AM89_9GAMM|nr:MAG: DNA polymerase [Candidatus Kentron sp. UNK]VFK72510.1 MAG: DNA polymerase [Candidatus Kentron sp. UNK]
MDNKRQSYLDILGIPLWQSRANAVAEATCPFRSTTPVPFPSPVATKDSRPVADDAPPSPATDHIDGGIPPHDAQRPPRGESSRASAPEPALYAPPQSVPIAASPDATAPDWEALRAQVSACTACQLHKTRAQTVFGVGSPTADWMFIGEAPGADEDRQGEPFVGRAGRLLNAMLEAIDLKREDVYIANILKCRPPNNREPQPAEALACEGFLLRQIQRIDPRIIIAVGRIAAQNLLATTTAIGRLRGRRFTFRDTGIPLVVTYHPAYLLRSPLQKRRSWEDLLLARAVHAKVAEESKIPG